MGCLTNGFRPVFTRLRILIYTPDGGNQCGTFAKRSQYNGVVSYKIMAPARQKLTAKLDYRGWYVERFLYVK